MRNLKRALSLTLASVMLLGMMVVGSSAAGFSDVDDNDNVEAIAVMQAVGVMVGDRETGNFRPDSKVTRNEMAVIMANLLLGQYEADSYIGVHPFTDVPAWADRYVAACYNAGIVSGVSATQYDGESNVTAVEAAAMMLRALGYEGLSAGASRWDLPVAAKANEVELFKGLTGNGQAQLSRNEVAKLGLNALETTMVNTYQNGLDIDIPGTVTITGSRTYTARTDSDGINYDGEGDSELQLCEKLYNGDLLKDPGEDSFNRPNTTWTYKGDEIVTQADEADRVYTSPITAKDLYRSLGLRADIDSGDLTVYVDGNGSDADYSGAAIEKDDSENEFGKKGQTIYAYYTRASEKEDDEVILCIVSTYLGVVVDDDAHEDDEDGVKIDTLEGELFYASTAYKEGDILLVTIADEEIQEILGAPQTFKGEVTRVDDDDDTLTIDKKDYEQSVKYTEGDKDYLAGEDADVLAVENVYTLYLDQNGYYLAAVLEEDNTSTDLVYVHDLDIKLAISGDTGKFKIFANVVYMDGTVKPIPLGDGVTDPDELKVDDNEWKDLPTTLAMLTYDEDDDEYTLAAPEEGDGYDVSEAENAPAEAVELKANTRYAALTTGGDANIYLDKNTVYLFITEDDGSIDKVETITGGVDFTIEASTKVAFATGEGKNTAEYVVIMDEYSSSAKDVLYISDNTNKGTIKDGKTFEGYVNGEKDSRIPVDGNGENVAQTGFYTYTEKTNGNYKLTYVDPTAKEEGKEGADTGVIKGEIENDLIILTVEDTDSVPYDLNGVKVIDLTDKSDESENAYGANVTSLGTLRRVTKNYDVTVDIYVNKDDEILQLFITKIEEKETDGGGKTEITGLTFDGTLTVPTNGEKVPTAPSITTTGVSATAAWTYDGNSATAGTTEVATGKTLTLVYTLDVTDGDAYEFGTVTGSLGGANGAWDSGAKTLTFTFTIAAS